MIQATRPSARWCTLWIAGWLAAGTGALCRGQESKSIRFDEKTTLTFASVEQAKEVIGTRDDFIERLGALEIQLRMNSADPVSKVDFLASLQAHVRQWGDDEVALVESAAKVVRERMQDYRLPLPEQILLIRVSAQVEGNAPHCRGAAIVLPDAFFARPKEAAGTLAHELFHVLSRHNPELRDRLYGIIHFERTNEVLLPDALQAQRVTNPDAPSNQHVIRLTVRGEKTPVVPVLLTKTKEFRPGGVFPNMDFKLMVLNEKDGKFTAKLVDGRPQLLSPREVPDYLRKIGRNTGYIIHPEEVLADNFSLMILGSDRTQDAWVIDEMKDILKE